MSDIVTNPVDFSAECALDHGQCLVVRENIRFFDDGSEHMAVSHLQMRCGHIVIIPDPSTPKRALLYHTSCQRMTDVVQQIFQAALQAPASLPQLTAEMSLGELHRRCVTLPYDECKARVKRFNF